MSSPVTLADLRERAHKLWVRDGRRWAAGQADSASIDIPLHPPTERAVLADYAGALDWVAQWRAAPSAVAVTWATRQWGRVGAQSVPERASITGPQAIATIAGVRGQWERWRARCAALSVVGDVQQALVTHARTIGEYPDADFDRLLATATWLREHPTSGYFPRQLPIRGIDSKWLERHVAVLQALVGNLGLREPAGRARIRFLDPTQAPAGLTDVTTEIAAWNSLAIAPRTALIVENLQTFLALPYFPGVVAVDGHGDLAAQLVGIHWLRTARCIYWGDLDSHGLRILSQARGAGMSLTSCLMDTETLLAFEDLWVPEPAPFGGTLPHLTLAEQQVLDVLRQRGNVRLEQERIAWHYALEKLRAAL
jgi:hypothetical protein